MKIKTDPIDSDRLYSIAGSIMLRLFAKQCGVALTDPEQCRLIPVYARTHKMPERGSNRLINIYDAMCDISRLLDKFIHIRCFHDEELEKEALDIIDRYDCIDWNRTEGDYSFLEGFRKRSIELADAIVRKKSVDIQTIVFISPDRCDFNHLYSVYHNGKLRSLPPFGYDCHYRKLVVGAGPCSGIECISEVDMDGLDRDIHFVYSEAFENRCKELRYNERGVIVPVNMNDVCDLEKMVIDGSDFVDLGRYYHWGEVYERIKEYNKSESDRKRDSFLDCVGAAVPF